MGLTLRGAGGQCAAATAGFRRREFAGDRCASCGSPCVHAGRSSVRVGRAKSAREPRDVVEPASAPGVWVPLRWIVYDWWREAKKTRSHCH